MTEPSQSKQGLAGQNEFPEGFFFLPEYLSPTAQVSLIRDIGRLLAQAPLFEQAMPRSGAPLSVSMSNAGEYGWVTDREKGYRYQRVHPVTGQVWPPIPGRLLNLWRDVTLEEQLPNLCLINYYDRKARLGLHQDKGDSSLDAPVVSISLGDEATFLLGGLSRRDPIRRIVLRTGDVVWFGGPSRLVFHGVEGIRTGTSRLLEKIGLPEGRMNLTLRRIGGSGQVSMPS